MTCLLQRLPEFASFLDLEKLSSLQHAVFVLGQLSQRGLVLAETGHDGGRCRVIPTQRVHHNFTHSIDLIFVGMLQDVLTGLMFGFVQEGS